MIKHITILIAFLMTIGSQVSAFDPDGKQKLEDTKQCAQCDLQRATLRGANLRYANLEGADLYGANLLNATLRGVNLEAADLRGANLEGAKMKGAILCNTIMPDGSVIYSGC